MSSTRPPAPADVVTVGHERHPAMMPAFSEDRRQAIHIAMVAFALLLRFLTWWQAAALAALALLFNAMLLPRVGGRALYRPADTARGIPLGILLYPLSVLFLILAFPRRPDIVAAAWAILAVGDGMATIVGRRLRGRALPWNPEKSVAGSLAFGGFGSVAAVAFATWNAPAAEPAPSWLFLVIAPIVAAWIAAAVESIPIRLDDNIAVPAAAGVVLWCASSMSADALGASAATVSSRVVPALCVNAAMAWLAWRVRTVSVSGAITGALLGTAIYAGAGGWGWLLLLATFLAASATSRVGLARKSRMGIAEERGGRRGAGNAVANVGVAALAAVLAVTSPYRDAALLALVAALTAGGSDTVASELGKAWGRRTFLVVGWRRVPPGTPGAISVEGTVAGIAAAAGLGLVGAAGGLMSVWAVPAVVVAATAGAFLESALGATLEPRGIVNNDVLNFINTGAATLVALAIAGLGT